MTVHVVLTINFKGSYTRVNLAIKCLLIMFTQTKYFFSVNTQREYEAANDNIFKWSQAKSSITPE